MIIAVWLQDIWHSYSLITKKQGQLLTDEKVFSHMSSVINMFKKYLKVPLLLENTPDCLIDRCFYKFIPYVLPEQINRLVYDNDVSLLLDITHAKITAKFHGWDIYGYLDSLLLDRVKEIHVNGCGHDKEGILMDSHQKMENEDFALLDWVLCRTNPEIISLEYSGKNHETIEEIENNILEFFEFF